MSLQVRIGPKLQIIETRSKIKKTLLEDLRNVLKRAFLNRGKVGNVFKSCDKMFQSFKKLLCDVSRPLLVFDFRVLRRSLWRVS